VGEIETPAIEPVLDEVVETKSPTQIVADENAKETAEIADAKNKSVQTPAVLNETKPADEAQEKINEDLEKQ
jgi:hypothetical protein